MKKKKVVVNYIYNMSYQVLSFLTPIITAPILTRTLGSENIGIYDYTYSIVNWFIIFGMLGVTLYGNKEVAKASTKGRDEVSKTFSQIFTMQMTMVFISFALFLLVFGLTNFEYKNIYLIQGILIFVFFFEISWLYVGLENFKKVAIRNILIKILTVLGIVFLVKSKNDLILYTAFVVITTILSNLSLFKGIKKVVDVKIPNFDNFKKHLKETIGLFIPQIATTIYLVFSKTLIGILYPKINEVGFYNYADKMTTMVLYLVTTIGTVMLPHVVNTIASGKEDEARQMTNQTFKISLFLSLPIAIGLGCLAPYFIPWFLTNEFTKTGYVISCLAPTIVFISLSNVLGVQYLISFERTRQYTISIVSGSVVNVISNLILIRELGAYGAAISACLTEFTVLMVQYFFVRKDFNFEGVLSKLFKYLVCAVIMGICVFLIGQWLGIGFLTNICQVIVGVVVYFVLLLITKDDILYFMFSKVKEIFKRK